MRSTVMHVSVDVKTRCDSVSHIQALAPKSLRNTPIFWCFQDDLYQAERSECSALQWSRLQSLTHPYNPLKNHAVFRINRNPGLSIQPYLNKSFGMNMLSRALSSFPPLESPNYGNFPPSPHHHHLVDCHLLLCVFPPLPSTPPSPLSSAAGEKGRGGKDRQMQRSRAEYMCKS